MATIKVILRQDVPSLGTTGEIKQVAPGYFRNFLLPRGLAIEATAAHMNSLEASARSRAGQLAKSKARSGDLAEQIKAITLQIPVRLGEQGRIYGSVTNKDIAEALAAQAKLSIDRHKIELSEPLKSIGTHSVPIKLEHGVDASVNVELVPEAEAAS
jgi:large subunit ribosomal protein L9